MSIFSKGWNFVSNASKFAGLGDAAYVAAGVVAEGSAPIAAALTEAGIATTAGSLLATAALVLEAAVIFTAIAACVVAPVLLFDYLSSGSSEAESTVEADKDAKEASVGVKLSDSHADFQVSELHSSVEATGLDFAPEAA